MRAPTKAHLRSLLNATLRDSTDQLVEIGRLRGEVRSKKLMRDIANEKLAKVETQCKGLLGIVLLMTVALVYVVNRGGC
jgi:hypothetical protein